MKYSERIHEYMVAAWRFEVVDIDSIIDPWMDIHDDFTG